MLFSSGRNKENKTDQWLIDQFRETADLEYLGVLFERYMHLVFGVCIKYLKDREASKDATMQIFEKLIIELPKREVENFKPWLHVITKNHCLMQLRSEKSDAARKDKIENNAAFLMESSYDMHPNNEVNLEDDLKALKKCIEQLKQEQKECVKLFYLEEKCYQEIADALNFEMKKVKSHIQNGKRNLKICVEQHARG